MKRRVFATLAHMIVQLLTVQLTSPEKMLSIALLAVLVLLGAPPVSHGQPPKTIPRLCFLNFRPYELGRQPGIDKFFQALRDLGYVDGRSIIIDYLSADGRNERFPDQDLVVVLLDLRWRLIEEYGKTPAAMMLIDRAITAYQEFIRVTGWTGNTSLMIEHEFFGRDRPCFEFRDRRGQERPEIQGLTVEQHLARLREGLLPLAERCGRVMLEALAALETLRAGPSQTVERSRPVQISIVFEPVNSIAEPAPGRSGAIGGARSRAALARLGAVVRPEPAPQLYFASDAPIAAVSVSCRPSPLTSTETDQRDVR